MRLLAVWVWRARVTWPAFPGRSGSIGGTFTAPRWTWLARRLAEAKAGHRQVEGGAAVDFTSLRCDAA